MIKSKKKLAVCICVGKVKYSILHQLVKEINSQKINDIKETIIILSMDDNSGPTFWKEASKLTRQYDSVLLTITKIKKKNYTYARSFLAGFERALKEKADIIVEMDIGTHDPKLIPYMVSKINDKDCVFSTRFSLGGDFINYPLQRKLISRIGTILSNLLLNIHPTISDMTSGYEVFTSDLLRKLFLFRKPNEWISVHSTPHLFQTEIRTYALMHKARFTLVPITYGISKKGVSLPLSYLIRSLLGFFALIKVVRSYKVANI